MALRHLPPHVHGPDQPTFGPRQIDNDRAVFCLRQLLEGMSLRATKRLTGVARRTITGRMVEAGVRCQRYLEALRNVPAHEVQVDEIWSFVRCKERTRLRRGLGEEVGDAWTFLAIERATKQILAFHVGKRTPEAALLLTEKLRRVTRPQRLQLSTDGFTPYPGVIDEVFGPTADYGQVVEIFGNAPDRGPAARYSPGRVIGVYRSVVAGDMPEQRISTSHVERQNKTLRMQIKRFARLTDAHSKKWENHEAAVALFVMYYNFARVHMTLNTTPAVASGIADHVWSVGEMLDRIGEVGVIS